VLVAIIADGRSSCRMAFCIQLTSIAAWRTPAFPAKLRFSLEYYLQRFVYYVPSLGSSR